MIPFEKEFDPPNGCERGSVFLLPGPCPCAASIPAGDFRSCQPRFHEHNLRQNNDRFRPLRDLAGDLGISPAQLALAWLLHQGDAIVPIPGMTSRWQVEENLAAASASLDADVLERIDRIAAPGIALGPELI